MSRRWRRTLAVVENLLSQFWGGLWYCQGEFVETFFEAVTGSIGHHNFVI
jgi:hypothetical protein